MDDFDKKIARDLYVVKHIEVKRILNEIKLVDVQIQAIRSGRKTELQKTRADIMKRIKELMEKKQKLKKDLIKAKAVARKEFTLRSKHKGGLLAEKPTLVRVSKIKQPGSNLAPEVRLIRGEKLHSKLPKLAPRQLGLSPEEKQKLKSSGFKAVEFGKSQGIGKKKQIVTKQSKILKPRKPRNEIEVVYSTTGNGSKLAKKPKLLRKIQLEPIADDFPFLPASSNGENVPRFDEVFVVESKRGEGKLTKQKQRQLKNTTEANKQRILEGKPALGRKTKAKK